MPFRSKSPASSSLTVTSGCASSMQTLREPMLGEGRVPDEPLEPDMEPPTAHSDNHQLHSHPQQHQFTNGSGSWRDSAISTTASHMEVEFDFVRAGRRLVCGAVVVGSLLLFMVTMVCVVLIESGSNLGNQRMQFWMPHSPLNSFFMLCGAIFVVGMLLVALICKGMRRQRCTITPTQVKLIRGGAAGCCRDYEMQIPIDQVCDVTVHKGCFDGGPAENLNSVAIEVASSSSCVESKSVVQRLQKHDKHEIWLDFVVNAERVAQFILSRRDAQEQQQQQQQHVESISVIMPMEDSP